MSAQAQWTWFLFLFCPSVQLATPTFHVDVRATLILAWSRVNEQLPTITFTPPFDSYSSNADMSGHVT